MVEVPINYGAMILAAVLNMALGFVWYGPLFGKTWMGLMGITTDAINAQKAKEGMWKGYLLTFVGSLVTAYVLAHVLVFASYYTQTWGIQAGLMAGFWSWLGFIAPVTLGSVLWEGKPWKLWFLNNGYQLISLLLMSTVLALWV